MMSGNTNKAGNGCGCPDASSLFVLTNCTDPGIGLTGERVGELGKAVNF